MSDEQFALLLHELARIRMAFESMLKIINEERDK